MSEVCEYRKKKIYKLKDGYFDMCINISKENVTDLDKILWKLYSYEYRVVALNQFVDEGVFDNDKKRKKKDEEDKAINILPDPIDIHTIDGTLSKAMCILNRITFICSDPAKIHLLTHCTNFKRYDLYAVMPKTPAMLQFVCSQVNADLILMKSSATTTKLNRKLYQQAVERDMHFEIHYADLMQSETRKMTVYLAHLFYTYGKSKNMVISSGANNKNMLRDPYDIINLGSLLGLDEMKARDAILRQGYQLFLRAEKRLCGKATFTFEFTEKQTNENQQEKKMSSDIQRE